MHTHNAVKQPTLPQSDAAQGRMGLQSCISL